MIRTTLIALAGILALGSASALAGQIDGDANAIPGVQISRQASDIERSYAGPHRQSGSMPQAFYDRPSQVD